MKLRVHQEKSLEEVKVKLKKYNELIISLFMGGGKTILISELTKYLKEEENKKIAILVNISDLIPQIQEVLDMYNIKYNLIKSNEEFEDNDSGVYLIMEQSFHINKRKQLNIDIDILIKDEYHIGYYGKRFNEIKESLNPEKIIGLSGTPIDEKGYLLKGIKENQLINYGNAKELTRLGHLVPLKFYTSKWIQSIDLSKIKMSGNDYSQSDLDKQLNNLKNNMLIVKSMNQLKAKKKNTLVYCNSIEHANDIYQLLKKDGYNVGVVHSKNEEDENKDIINNFGENKKYNCLVSVSKLTTGFNSPDAELIVLCRPTKILRLYLQILFRVARYKEGKEFAEVLDLSQSVQTHGFGLDDYWLSERKSVNINKKNEELEKKKVIKEIIKNKSTPIEISEDILKVKIKKLKQEMPTSKNTTLVDLLTDYKNSSDIENLIRLAFEINYRINEKKYTYLDIENFIKKQENEKIYELKEKIRKEIKQKIF